MNINLERKFCPKLTDLQKWLKLEIIEKESLQGTKPLGLQVTNNEKCTKTFFLNKLTDRPAQTRQSLCLSKSQSSG